MQEAVNRLNRRKFLQGIVVSDKMNKTRVVQVKWTTKHGKYYKVLQQFKKYKAHDEKNESKAGDVVRIMESRRLSKDKRWVITNVLQSGAVEQVNQ